MRAGWLLFSCAIGGCYSPSPADCAYLCAGTRCPSGFTCDNEGYCRVANASGSCVADAAIDASCRDDTPHMLVFQDPADATPAGWTCVSCLMGDPFYHRFPVGAASFGGQGGSDMHSHTFTATGRADTGHVTQIGAGGTDVAPASHTHTSPTGMTTLADHIPPFRDMKIIRPIAQTLVLPMGAIVMFDTDVLPAGLTRYSDVDGLLIRGGDTAATGGTTMHQHMFSGMLTSASSAIGALVGGLGCSTAHAHTFAGTTLSAGNDPDHALVVLARVTSEVALPPGMVAMFDAPPAAGWEVLSAAGGSLAGDYLKASAVADFGSHGETAHVHGTTPVTSSLGSAQSDFASGSTAVSTNEHVHIVDVTIASASQRPTYSDVILAKLAPAGCQ